MARNIVLTNERKAYIIANYDRATDKEIADHLGIPIRVVREYACRNKMKKPYHLTQRISLTESDKELMKGLYHDYTDEEIAEKFNIPVKKVASVAAQFGWKKNKELAEIHKKQWNEKIKEKALERGIGISQEKELEVIRLYPDYDSGYISEKLGITPAQVRWIQKKYKLHKTKEYLDNKKKRTAEKNAEKVRKKEERSLLAEERKEEKKLIKPRRTKKRDMELYAKRREREKNMEAVPDVNIKARLIHKKEVISSTNEPCVRKQCKCWNYCRKTKKSDDTTCDAYMYKIFPSEEMKQRWLMDI